MISQYSDAQYIIQSPWKQHQHAQNSVQPETIYLFINIFPSHEAVSDTH